MTLQPKIVFDASEYTYRELESDVFGIRSKLSPGSKLILSSLDPLETIASFVALDRVASEVHLLPAGVEFPSNPGQEFVYIQSGHLLGQVSGGITKNQFHHSVGEIDFRGETTWFIYSSGTTSTPKAIPHTFKTLTRQIRTQNSKYNRLVWGLTFDPARMAGIQVLLNAYKRSETIVMCPRHYSLAMKIDKFIQHHVNAVSGTPSMYREMLRISAFKHLNLEQITLGGEIVDQVILDGLREVFPKSRITHIYASSELGFGFAVSDGKEGFPVSYLDSTISGYNLSIHEGELFFLLSDSINSKNPAKLDTGDLVQLEGERVFFRGRKSGGINVAGAKVWPEEVEKILLMIPGVQQALVFGIRSSQAGELLSAKVVTDGSVTSSDIRRQLKTSMPSFQVPAIIEIVDNLEITSNGKIHREL